MRREFTLIELVAVLATLAILTSIVFPHVSEIQGQAVRTAISGDVRNIQTAVDHFSLSTNGGMPTAEAPTIQIPQSISFSALEGDFLRSVPDTRGAFYWVDFSGRVWASIVEAPRGLSMSMDGFLSWAPVEGASHYLVYAVSGGAPAGSLSQVGLTLLGKTTETSFAGSVGGINVVSAVDRHGLESAPAGTGYIGSLPLAVIGMSPSPVVPIHASVQWSFAGSSAPSGRTITAALWRLNGGSPLETLPALGFPEGRNVVELRVQDSTGIWSPWASKAFEVVPVKWDVISAGDVHTLGIQNGELWAWGGNSHGQLGVGDLIQRNVPVRVGDLTGWQDVSTGSTHTLAIRNGELWAWGQNWHGALGVGDTDSRNTPTRVGTFSDWTSVSAGVYHSAGIRNGELWIWGWNSNGQIGIEGATLVASPVRVGAATGWSDVSAGGWHTVAIRIGELWSWGWNAEGQLGLSDTLNRATPHRVGDRYDWTKVTAGGSYNLAIARGQLFSWGWNAEGQLGLSDTVDRYLPTRVGVRANWTDVSLGWGHALAISRGELWSWGRNAGGQLGTGGIVQQSTPVQVGRETNWTQVEAGGGHSLALRSGGLWAFGWGYFGQLGTGYLGDLHGPAPVHLP